jgi:hypothetical protein
VGSRTANDSSHICAFEVDSTGNVPVRGFVTNRQTVAATCVPSRVAQRQLGVRHVLSEHSVLALQTRASVVVPDVRVD